MAKSRERKGELMPRTRRELSPFEDVDRMFDRLFEGGWMSPFAWRVPEWTALRDLEERVPSVDVIDREDEILVRAEIPGMRKEDVDVSISGDLLTIRGETREEKEEKGEYYRSEIRRGTFTRAVRLPAAVDMEKAKARFEAGMLEITLPKTEKAVRHSIHVE
ncbi:MAG: Hsp20/alpha crystallin family protein [Chromatiales bacterium]|jgi:HSP20 family protein